MKRIAILVSPENTCPPTTYGGSERRAAIYAELFLQRGLQVDVFCGEGSTVPATHRFEVPRSMGTQGKYIDELLRLNKTNYQYDAVLDMTPHHIASNIQNLPVVSVMGGDPMKLYPHDHVRNRVYVSRALAQHFDSPNHPVVHNIVHKYPESIEIGQGDGDYALFVGAIRPEKGLTAAIAETNAAGMSLRVYGPKTDPAFYESIRHDIIYCGMLPAEGKGRWDVFRDARVFMYPVEWCDACPLAPIEAMLCGTPIVGKPNGGLIEMMDYDVAGFWLEGEPGETIKRINTLDRHEVRESILPKIVPQEAAQAYYELLDRAAKGENW